jgi:hypothetical protein
MKKSKIMLWRKEGIGSCKFIEMDLDFDNVEILEILSYELPEYL